MASENKLDSANNGILPNRDDLFNNVAESFGSILAIRPIAKYMSGARCVLRMNGKIIGFAFGISWRIHTSVTEINTIDNYEAHELAPKRIEVSGSISMLRIPGSGPGVLLLQPDVLLFLHQKYIEIEVRDSQTDNLLFLTRKAMITNRTENVRVNNLADVTLEFRAIGFQDERTPISVTEIQKKGSDGKGQKAPLDTVIEAVGDLFK